MKQLLLVVVLVATARAQHYIALSWTPSTDAADSQTLYRGTAPGAENYSIPIATFADNTTSAWNDTSGMPGLTYYYTVSAWNSQGESAQSNESFAQWLSDTSIQGVALVGVQPQ